MGVSLVMGAGGQRGLEEQSEEQLALGCGLAVWPLGGTNPSLGFRHLPLGPQSLAVSLTGTWAAH